ncbi:hypothetical protein BKE38_05090 [Pseudoroseomonas deserti]|uniref:Uncharacterized protein n=1 Tax=Teichococcus deserti TaxID=1817963 RepID=A0A1V2H6T3_9PROT|nr:hypothetical protein [Pseudoroseomonas deserti]ONG56971.1 hypothetical protein BKE38_05090 [Pseudoroseomonas deserti]
MNDAERSIERNPTDELPSDAIFPALRCYDGPHSQAPAPAVGETAYRMTWTVEGFVEAEFAGDAPGLDAEMNALLARVIGAIILPEAALEIPLADGTLELWGEDTAFDIERTGAATSEKAGIRFTQEFVFQVWTTRGNAFVETL